MDAASLLASASLHRAQEVARASSRPNSRSDGCTLSAASDKALSNAKLVACATTLSQSQRFTDSEKQAFGRWAHVKARSRLAGSVDSLRTSLASTTDTMQRNSRLLNEEMWPSSCSSSVERPVQDRSAPLDTESRRDEETAEKSRRRSSLTLDLKNLGNVLEELLPVEEVASPCIPASCSLAKALSGQIVLSAATSTGARPRSSTQPRRPRLCRIMHPVDSKRSSSDALDAGKTFDPEHASLQLQLLDTPSEPSQPRRVNAHQHTFERFRWQLLQRFRSLADAFSQLHDLAVRENSLNKQAFIRSFGELGIQEDDSAKVFDVMDIKGLGTVSLASLRSMLSTSSRQALLWELRCRLLAASIGPQDFSKVRKILAVARRPRHRTVRQRRNLRSVAGLADGDLASDADMSIAAGDEASAQSWSVGSFSASTSLSRQDWLAVCAAIGLTVTEAEKLFKELVSDGAPSVDLKEMFAALRCGVAPNVSLEKFATRILSFYNSFAEAFAQISTQKGIQNHRVVRWLEFHQLAVCLDVQDDNAAQLWRVLTLAETARRGSRHCSPQASARVEASEACITEETFVRELSVWAPTTPLDGLRNQVEELFHSWEDLRRALEKAGFACNVEVTAAEIRKALQAVGIRTSHSEQLHAAASSMRRGAPRRRRVTLDAIIALMQGRALADPGAWKSAVRTELCPVWQQMHAMQASLSAPTL